MVQVVQVVQAATDQSAVAQAVTEWAWESVGAMMMVRALLIAWRLGLVEGVRASEASSRLVARLLLIVVDSGHRGTKAQVDLVVVTVQVDSVRVLDRWSLVLVTMLRTGGQASPLRAGSSVRRSLDQQALVGRLRRLARRGGVPDSSARTAVLSRLLALRPLKMLTRGAAANLPLDPPLRLLKDPPRRRESARSSN